VRLLHQANRDWCKRTRGDAVSGAGRIAADSIQNHATKSSLIRSGGHDIVDANLQKADHGFRASTVSAWAWGVGGTLPFENGQVHHGIAATDIGDVSKGRVKVRSASGNHDGWTCH